MNHIKIKKVENKFIPMPCTLEEFKNCISEIPPFNSDYINGEEFITWDYLTIYNRFSVDCYCIDAKIISKANAFKNELTLIDGTVVTGINFTIRLYHRDGSSKNYEIQSLSKLMKPHIKEN